MHVYMADKNVRVELSASGAPAGCMLVHDVGLDSSDLFHVSASLPQGLTSHDGRIDAVVFCGPAPSNAVALGLRQTHEISVSTRVAPSGASVIVTVCNVCGGPVCGLLKLTGPGRFSNGSTAVPVDGWGTVSKVIMTEKPGSIEVEFLENEGPEGPADMNELFD